MQQICFVQILLNHSIFCGKLRFYNLCLNSLKVHPALYIPMHEYFCSVNTGSIGSDLRNQGPKVHDTFHRLKHLYTNLPHSHNAGQMVNVPPAPPCLRMFSPHPSNPAAIIHHSRFRWCSPHSFQDHTVFTLPSALDHAVTMPRTAVVHEACSILGPWTLSGPWTMAGL